MLRSFAPAKQEESWQLKGAALFYFALALGVGFGHYVNDLGRGQNPISSSAGAGLSWPWLVVEFAIDRDLTISKVRTA